MRKLNLLSLLVLFLISACSSQPSKSTLAPASAQQNATSATSIDQGYPAQGSGKPAATADVNTGDHFVLPGETAFQSLPVAEAAAKKWKKGAVLVEIPRLRQMETNLTLPKGPSGWFYMFMDPTDGSSVEYYVEVIKMELAGKTEAQHIYTGNPPYKLQPIDMTKKLLDSTDVYTIYLKNGGEQYIKGKGRVEIDFQLVRLENMENPVWSIFNTADPAAPPLINVDAVTGQVVKDPFDFLRK